MAGDAHVSQEMPLHPCTPRSHQAPPPCPCACGASQAVAKAGREAADKWHVAPDPALPDQVACEGIG